MFDGWLLRFARGYTKRANSVNPTFAGRLAPADKIATCEAHYARFGLPTVFRLPSIAPAPGLDDLLAARGYDRLDKTSVRVARLGRAGGAIDSAVGLAAVPSQEWLDAHRNWHGLDDGRAQTHRAILAAIPHPAAFAIVREADTVAAIGVCVAQGELACLNDIVTDPSRRRHGHSRRLTMGLMAWARREGAAQAYLQVVKTNAPALALYGKLGFDREVYRYHYRIEPNRVV